MNKKNKSCGKPALWGGLECTINRVGDQWRDQLALTGHYDRRDDLEMIAGLGIQAIRYPILWERHQPERNGSIDWRWVAGQLQQLKELKITPIAGLLHHGSGPAYTHLSDPDFPYLFRDYAAAVAIRFPGISEYTPVNEPLTTARFSGLYGLWYPHMQDEYPFLSMLLNELKATVLAMEAIRLVNSGARLIQTEDLGKTHSTPLLAYQASFENERRWLTFDLLCGRLIPGHALWNHLTGAGISEDQILFFADHPCVPDVMGLNYYVTSERWLDDQIIDSENQHVAGNGIHRYTDTEMVRANPSARSGFSTLAREVWDRYQVPLAVTEVHLNCTREEQLRWFAEIWSSSTKLTEAGIPVEGVTAWSLFGALDWDSLLVDFQGHYESGVFDIRSGGTPRKTALAHYLSTLQSDEPHHHALLEPKGWWHGRQLLKQFALLPKLFLLGNGGLFQECLIRACNQRGIPHLPGNAKPGEQEAIWKILQYHEDPKKRSFMAMSGQLTVLASMPPSLDDVVNRVLDLLIDDCEGVWRIEGNWVRPERFVSSNLIQLPAIAENV